MSRLEHPLSPEELMEYADGQIQGSNAVNVAEHLNRCSECASVVADAHQMSTQMAAWQVEECPDGVTQRVQTKLKRYVDARTPSETQRGWWSRYRVWFYGLGAAGATVVLLLTITVPTLLRSRQAAQESPKVAATMVEQPVAQSEPQPIPSGPMVIRTVNLTMITKDFDAARSRIDAIVRQSQGYIDRLTVRADTGSARGLSATLRVPASRVDAALENVQSLGRLVQESQNSSDITGQYVDLAARLSNARNSEQRLLGLLRDRAGDLKDVVAMEREISTVRESIERMEAQRKDLDNKVQYATIQLELNEEYHAQLEPPAPSTGTQLRNAAIDGIQSGAESTVDIAFFVLRYGPSLFVWFTVLGCLLLAVLRLSRMELRRRP